MTDHPEPTTVEELKSALTRSGLHADEVNRAEDPEARKDEGAILVRTLPDGGCDLVTMGRGYETEAQHFASEAAAMQSLGMRLLHDRPPVHARSDAQRQADRNRMRVRREEIKREIEETQARLEADKEHGA
ncbi:MAG: hypothetical protein ACRDPH_05235 [Marmoricola sp.]